MKKTRIGFVGVGCISGIYLQNITHLYKELEIAGVCDLVREKAENASREYGVRVYQDMYELFADPSVDIVLNITRPNDHYEVTKAALEAGKHVYSEKPLATGDLDVLVADLRDPLHSPREILFVLHIIAHSIELSAEYHFF